MVFFSPATFTVCCVSVSLLRASCRVTLTGRWCVTSSTTKVLASRRYSRPVGSSSGFCFFVRLRNKTQLCALTPPATTLTTGQAAAPPLPSLRSGLGRQQHHGGRLRQEGGGLRPGGSRPADLRLQPRPHGEGVHGGGHQPQRPVGGVWQLRPVSRHAAAASRSIQVKSVRCL